MRKPLNLGREIHLTVCFVPDVYWVSLGQPLSQFGPKRVNFGLGASTFSPGNKKELAYHVVVEKLLWANNAFESVAVDENVKEKYN